MSDLRLDASLAEQCKPLCATIWPRISATDSESLRRRKFAVRAGHLAMVIMVLVAAGTGPVTIPSDFVLKDILCLAVASAIYIYWNLLGTQGVVTLVLWEKTEPASLELREPRCGNWLYFSIQLTLAAFICFMADHGHIPSMIWLALLPPVAYAVFIMEWPGIITTAFLAVLILTGCFRWWHDLQIAIYGGLSFSFAVLFSIVFSMLAVQSEKARNEVQRLATELSEANRRLREYAVQAEELSATRERNRIAREIHDSLGHFLTVVNMQLEAAHALWSTDPTRSHEAMHKAQAFAQEGLQDIRHSVASLRHSPLENKTLAQAMQELVPAIADEKPTAEFNVTGQPRSLPPAVELSLYRAAQEGLTNARKHSQATQVQVQLDFRLEKSIILLVRDNGRGVSPEANASGFGLRGLSERAQLLGGTLTTETAPGAGFTLKFQVPG